MSDPNNPTGVQEAEREQAKNNQQKSNDDIVEKRADASKEAGEGFPSTVKPNLK